jgi:hypothetical protein
MALRGGVAVDLTAVLDKLLLPLALLAGQLWLNLKFKSAEDKRDSARADTDAKRAAEAEWREKVVHRLDEQDERIDAVLQGQVNQMRSDVTHKIHRYMDDLGCASTEEKNSLNEEYKVYCLICEKFGIENDFVANMMEQVMALPSRSEVSS